MKVELMELVDSARGKYCKSNPNGVIFQKRKTGNVAYHVHNPYTGPASANQEAVKTRFKAAQEAVKEIRLNPSELKAYQDAFKANPGKYSTLQGFMVAAEFAKLA